METVNKMRLVVYKPANAYATLNVLKDNEPYIFMNEFRVESGTWASILCDDGKFRTMNIDKMSFEVIEVLT